MSGRSRAFKADQRRHTRFLALRDRIRADQAGADPMLVRDVVAAVMERHGALVIACDPERYARRWNASHPDPLPGGLGAAYHRRRA